MPRRRLHGETQKERQKKASRLLKLRGSAKRKQQTGTPLPFESSPQLDPQDVEFLEAMRDLSVQRLPGQGGAPARREAFERVRFAADTENDALFRSLMRDTGVVPLGAPAEPPDSHAQAHAQAAAPARDTAPARADDADIPDAPWAAPDEDARPSERALAPQDRPEQGPVRRTSGPAPALARRASAAPSPPQGGPAGTGAAAEGTRFEEGADDRQIMEEALRSGVASLNEKFQGAVRGSGARRPAGRAGAQATASRSTSTAEPDAELDLHGKTQEEAIRMVENFVLRAKHKRLRAVLIITGRGLNSGEQGPVLRNAVQSWLEHNGKPTVRRFAWAPPRLGGDGAIWVELW